MAESLIGLSYMENWVSGEYEFVLTEDDALTIRVKFTIDENGKILYGKPTFE